MRFIDAVNEYWDRAKRADCGIVDVIMLSMDSQEDNSVLLPKIKKVAEVHGPDMARMVIESINTTRLLETIPWKEIPNPNKEANNGSGGGE